MNRRVVDPSLWSDTPKEIVVDLSFVKTFDEFVRAMKIGFPLEQDPLEIWGAIRDGLFWQTSPLKVRFEGWSHFETVMPRYATKLKRLFRDHLGRVTVDYR
ncbi:MAG TPA: hypothetical protein VN903_23120 [Polyangia bacterium]|jgi:hypothetical protein|nr:hypothetical protein [Polyangia bacterium]